MSHNVAHGNDDVTKMPPTTNEREKKGGKEMGSLPVARIHPSVALGKRLKVRRIALGLSPAESAQAIGVRWGAYARMEKGVCDFNSHAKEVSGFLACAEDEVRRVVQLTTVEQEQLREKTSRALGRYQAMTDAGRRRQRRLSNTIDWLQHREVKERKST